ncbi:MAG: hypothetical protein ABS75_33195 [Pelagibacterium sp. SCN 63-23]|nr:MAG: hypothetical protein ABS75_33195 [Pelagibacterium sp. SCN 63-23]
MRYYEAFGEGGFHSAFMTTYAFGTFAFEDIPFPKLRGAGCRNIVVLADGAMVNQAFDEYGPPRFAGGSYHLIKARAPRAFHPKITILLGEAKGRLFVGSANLTALGLAGNKEQVASIEYSRDHPQTAHLFRSAIEYMRRYVPRDDQWFATALERARRASPWLAQQDGAASPSDSGATLDLLFDRPEASLLDQIGRSIGDDVIERLVVVSPYWDDGLEGLARLRERLGNPPTDILLDPDSGFPGDALSRFRDVFLFDISARMGKRFLHAKLILALGAGWDHVVSGSMNCTYPALLGPSANGNAEAAIYTRAARGSALPLLNLESYEGTRLATQQASHLEQAPVVVSDALVAPDGGTMTYQSSRLTWTSPATPATVPERIRLFSREGLLLAEVELDGRDKASFALPMEDDRPRHGRVVFAGGILSAPVMVTDVDVLAVATLPRRTGKQKRLVDSLADAMHEDLELIEMLNRLEEVEAADVEAQLDPAKKASRQNGEAEEQRTYGVLSYEAFIRARTNAAHSAPAFGLYQGSRIDRGVHVLSTCLNRMIGLVGADLAALEDSEIELQNAIDLRTTEPTADDDVAMDASTKQAKKRSEVARSLATAKKFKDAVDAFSERCAALKGKPITTSEIVRIRALMQIVLAYAQPVSKAATSGQVLPVYDVRGHDWPRLIGRLLMLHSGTTRALQYLSVEPDEAEQHRVLEYLALANWAAKAALHAAKSEGKARALIGPIERLASDLTVQTTGILAAFKEDQAYYAELSQKLDQRFANRMNVSSRHSSHPQYLRKDQ